MEKNNLEDETELSITEEEKRELFGDELYLKIKQAEDDIKYNRVHNAREVLEKFKKEYGFYERNNIHR